MILEQKDFPLILLQLAQSNKWGVILKKLQFASKTANTTLAEELSNTKNLYTGDTICHYAVYSNQLDVLKELHKIGVDLRAQNYFSQSPLEALKSKVLNKELPLQDIPYECIQFLLLNVYTPVERLFNGPNDFENTKRIFHIYPESIDDPLICYNRMTWACLCVEEGRLQDLKWLYLHGANFSVSDAFGNKLLHMIPIPACKLEDEIDYSADLASSCSSLCDDNNDSDDCSTIESNSESSIDFDDLLSNNIAIYNNMELKKLEPVRTISEKQLQVQNNLLRVYSQIKNVSSTNSIYSLIILGLTDSEKNVLDLLIFLLSLDIFNINETNNTGSTPCHIIAEKSEANPHFAFSLIQLLYRCGADLTICDDEGANVAMVLAANIGEGPWLTWCLTEQSRHGGGCNMDHKDTRGRKLEDYVAKAYNDAFYEKFDTIENYVE